MRNFSRALLACFVLTLSSFSMAQERLIEPYLEKGQIDEARKVVVEALEASSDNHELRFQLAVVQLLEGIERYSQSMHKLGLIDAPFGGMVPFLRFPVETNPNPAPATNEAVRAALDQLGKDLKQTRETLALIPDSWDGRLPLRLGRVRLDLNGDGDTGPKEELWRVMDGLNPGLALEEKTARQFGMHLDAGDVRWLEGYCHLLGGMLEVIGAYDTQRLFDHTGQLFFAKPVSPYPFLNAKSAEGGDSDFYRTIADGVAFIHLINLPVLDGQRLNNALDDFRQVISLSRRSWTDIQAETDDQYEWLPNPRQTSVVGGWKVTAVMIKDWMAFLDEAESVLAGETLVPFWRPVPEGQGVNLSKAFTQPTPFDAVLWLQGPAAAPYLESGKVSSPEFWERLNTSFNGQFLGYALWFN